MTIPFVSVFGVAEVTVDNAVVEGIVEDVDNNVEVDVDIDVVVVVNNVLSQ